MLKEWAKQYAIGPAAYEALLEILQGGVPASTPSTAGTSEARVQSEVRLEAARCGVWLTRNNVGVLRDANGRPVRYGLANESKAQNSHIKSGDLIGFWPRVIVANDVGKTIAQFVSRECKAGDWRYKGDAHELAQTRWATFINSHGGDAAFASGPGTFETRRLK